MEGEVNFRHKKSNPKVLFLHRNKKLFFAAKCTEALVEAINTAASV